MTDAAKRWLATYYPVPARDVPIQEAGNHSLRKWIGLQRHILADYGLRQSGHYISDAENTTVLVVDADSCAYCVHYLLGHCARCPIALTRQGCPCDKPRVGETQVPYGRFLQTGDAGPMIATIEQAITYEKEQKMSTKTIQLAPGDSVTVTTGPPPAPPAPCILRTILSRDHQWLGQVLGTAPGVYGTLLWHRRDAVGHWVLDTTATMDQKSFKDAVAWINDSFGRRMTTAED